MTRPHIVLICCNSDFLTQYTRVLVPVVGGANITACYDLNQLESQSDSLCALVSPLHRVVVVDGCAVAAASTFGDLPVSVQRVFETSSQLILLNQLACVAFADDFQRRFSVSKVADSYITDMELADCLRSLHVVPDIPLTIRRHRSSGVPVETGVGVTSTKHVNAILHYLKGRFLEDRDWLLTGFVTETSTSAEIDEPMKSRLPQLIDVAPAVGELRAFMQGAMGTGDGRVVVGEKGVGKTTLTHYAAATIVNESPNFVFIPVDYQWVPLFDIDRSATELNEACRELAINWDERRVGFDSWLKKQTVNRGWEKLEHPSLGTQSIITSVLADEATRVAMYERFVKTGSLESMIDVYDGRRAGFVTEAHEWIDRELADPRARLVFCALFCWVRRVARVEDFAYKRILASVLTAARVSPSVRDVLKQWIPSCVSQLLDDYSLDALALRRALKSEQVPIKELVIDLLRSLRESRHKMLLFLDNIDAKPTQRIELSLLASAVGLFREIREVVPIDVVISVRASTFSSLEFKDLDLLGTSMWTSLQLRPPDLGKVLKRRVDCMRESGDWIGAGEWFLTDFLHRWVTRMVEGMWPREFLDIIEARHPYNVRGQLDLFSAAATSTILHQRRNRARGGRDPDGWMSVKPDFCLRALVWGSNEFFVESKQQFVPNVFDNQCPLSPFNALLRPMVLSWASKRSSFTLEELFDEFVKAGVPLEEVGKACRAAEVFSTIRRNYEESDREWYLTSWGHHFLENVFCRLAYVQTVWWDVSMLDGYSVGSPRFLRWSELREPVHTFDLWLRTEEQLVRNAMNVPLEDLVGWSIWAKVSAEFITGLESIEKSAVHS